MYPWSPSAMLILESNHVIGLRLMKLACGGSEAGHEAVLMVTEKLAAAVEAGETFLRGGTVASVVDRYREHVGANAVRLGRGG